ncbi:unnamed protein product, partial [Symbiodinium sp. KB8]
MSHDSPPTKSPRTMVRERVGKEVAPECGCAAAALEAIPPVWTQRDDTIVAFIKYKGCESAAADVAMHQVKLPDLVLFSHRQWLHFYHRESNAGSSLVDPTQLLWRQRSSSEPTIAPEQAEKVEGQRHPLWDIGSIAHLRVELYQIITGSWGEAQSDWAYGDKRGLGEEVPCQDETDIKDQVDKEQVPVPADVAQLGLCKLLLDALDYVYLFEDFAECSRRSGALARLHFGGRLLLQLGDLWHMTKVRAKQQTAPERSNDVYNTTYTIGTMHLSAYTYIPNT